MPAACRGACAWVGAAAVAACCQLHPGRSAHAQTLPLPASPFGSKDVMLEWRSKLLSLPQADDSTLPKRRNRPRAPPSLAAAAAVGAVSVWPDSDTVRCRGGIGLSVIVGAGRAQRPGQRSGGQRSAAQCGCIGWR